MIKSMGILLSFQLLGELVRLAIGWPIPGPVTGMVLLLLALWVGLVRPETVEPAADVLLKALGLLFVPVGVGLMQYGHILKKNGFSIATALLVSTVAALIVTGWTAQWFQSRRPPERENCHGNTLG